jgi:hypothetical protein
MDEEKQTTEVRNTNEQVGDTNVTKKTVATSATVPSSIVAQRIVYYVGGVIIALLALRVVLLLLGANQGNVFVDFIYGLSGFFAVPFYGIFSYQPVYGQSTLEVSSLVAIIVYALLTWGIAKLFTLGSTHEDV